MPKPIIKMFIARPTEAGYQLPQEERDKLFTKHKELAEKLGVKPNILGQVHPGSRSAGHFAHFRHSVHHRDFVSLRVGQNLRTHGVKRTWLWAVGAMAVSAVILGLASNLAAGAVGAAVAGVGLGGGNAFRYLISVFPLVFAILAWLIASRLSFETKPSTPHPG